jgi:hypothetical protein
MTATSLVPKAANAAGIEFLNCWIKICQIAISVLKAGETIEIPRVLFDLGSTLIEYENSDWAPCGQQALSKPIRF